MYNELSVGVGGSMKQIPILYLLVPDRRHCKEGYLEGCDGDRARLRKEPAAAIATVPIRQRMDQRIRAIQHGGGHTVRCRPKILRDEDG